MQMTINYSSDNTPKKPLLSLSFMTSPACRCSFTADPIVFLLQVREMMTKRVEFLDEIGRMPDFIIALRPHTVWEKTPIKLFCTVQGNPRPVVKWSEL